jgi:AcrR family transcriptional regulator
MAHRGVGKESIQPQKRKEEILQKALRLFLLKGYEATSTNDICWAAKITKPTLYYYFPSKRHILHAAHVKAIERLLQPYLHKTNTIKDPLDRLYTMLKDYTIIVCTHPELRFLLHETLNFRDEQSKEIRKEWKRHYILLRNTIAELQTNGAIRSKLKPSGAALMILGMITWTTYWFDYKRKKSIDETAGLAIDMATHALGLVEYTGETDPKKVKRRAKK